MIHIMITDLVSLSLIFMVQNYRKTKVKLNNLESKFSVTIYCKNKNIFTE